MELAVVVVDVEGAVIIGAVVTDSQDVVVVDVAVEASETAATTAAFPTSGTHSGQKRRKGCTGFISVFSALLPANKNNSHRQTTAVKTSELRVHTIVVFSKQAVHQRATSFET